MKDPSGEVISAFYTALNGKCTLPVYSMVPRDVDDFIFIGDITCVGDVAKDRYITNNTIQIEIIKTYRDQGSKVAVNAISNTILGIIRNAFASTVTLTSFTVPLVVLDSMTDFVEETDEYKVFRKLIRFRLIIEEK